MANYKFTATLNSSSLNNLAKELGNYRRITLKQKMERLVDELMDVGIMVAYQKVGSFGKYGTHHMEDKIIFYKQIKISNQYETVGFMIGEGDVFKSTWQTSDGNVVNSTVKPLHMVEWGTAAFANNPSHAFGGYGGKGTMSVSGNENKTDWYFIDENGNKKLGTAIKPTMPMFNAYLNMYAQVTTIARRVFG